MNNFLIFCKKSRYLLALSLLMFLALSACDTPQVSVKKEWETTINSYGLRPVYPMRENVYVGDLRVTGHKKDDFSLNYRYFGQLDIAGVFKKEIKGRPELAETPIKTDYTITLADGTQTLQRFEQPSASDVTAPRGHSNRMFLAVFENRVGKSRGHRHSSPGWNHQGAQRGRFSPVRYSCNQVRGN